MERGGGWVIWRGVGVGVGVYITVQEGHTKCELCTLLNYSR